MDDVMVTVPSGDVGGVGVGVILVMSVGCDLIKILYFWFWTECFVICGVDVDICLDGCLHGTRRKHTVHYNMEETSDTFGIGNHINFCAWVLNVSLRFR